VASDDKPRVRERGGPRNEKKTDRRLAGVGWVLLLGIGVVLAVWIARMPRDPHPSGEPEPTAEVEPAQPPVPPRCQAFGPAGGFRIGEAPAKKAPAPQVAPDDDEPDDEPLEPFAVEVGRGTVIPEGFAVGIKRDRDGKTVGEVALLDERADQGELVDLGPLRGDVDAPVVVPAGQGWAVAMLEPNASGFTLRIGRRADGKLAWGAELEQGRDESLAYDLVLGSDTGVAVWDDVTDDGDESHVVLATLAADTLAVRDQPKRVSPANVDAELPRLVARPGGFWLAYVARPRQKAPKEKEKNDDREPAERIDSAYVEVVPLDAQGHAEGAPRAVTPENGNVLAFDIAESEGGVLVAWRDDDTPTGAQGGRAALVQVTAAGAVQTQPIEADDLGAGVPSLVGGWLALPGARGRQRLAPMQPSGELRGTPLDEPLVGVSEILAAHGDVFLLARPDGKAVALVTVRCTPNEGIELAPDAGASDDPED
jgi:hypothetical protein